MIEKLDKFDSTEASIYHVEKLYVKINQLVDAVNSIVSVQEKLMDSRFVVETKHEEPADPYAEQRKWIGKLCWYKLCEGDVWKVGRLEKIQENADAGYPFVFDGLCYKICEPVKPDSDIIYKGE